MATTSTPQAFVVRSAGIYDDRTRQHPATAWIEKNQAFFDAGDYSDPSAWYHEAFSVHSQHGEHATSTAGEGFSPTHSWSSWAAKFYAEPFDSHQHFHSELIVLDAADGYDLYWFGKCYANLKGDGNGAGEKVKDANGKEWDVAVPAAYHFELVKDDGAAYGLKMRHLSAFKDTGIINDALEKRDQGHLKTVK